MSKTIEIIIAPDGSSKIETKGFEGASCREASRFIEQALGKTVKETTTAEFYQMEQSLQHKQKEGG
jgi:hypothetical protein